MASMPAEAWRLHACIHQPLQGSKAFCGNSSDDPAPTFFVECSEWHLAIVRRINRPRGVGYLSLANDRPDILVDMQTLRRFGFGKLSCGQRVEIRYCESDGRWIITGMR